MAAAGSRRQRGAAQRAGLRGHRRAGRAAAGVRPLPLRAGGPCVGGAVRHRDDARGGRRRGIAIGAVAEGPVGARWAGRLSIFRYEVRRWRDGRIPDIEEAVGGARCLSEDAATAQRVLDLVPDVPRLVWGRDELGTGDMWNSNSVIAWLLAGAGIDAASIAPPDGGRAPGWHAGLVAARGSAPTA